MDLQMPRMGGVEAARTMRGSPIAAVARVPIVALTANLLAADQHECEQAGMNGFLSKPFQPSELFRLVEQQSLGPIISAQTNPAGPPVHL